MTKTEVYFNFSKKILEKTKEESNKEGISNSGNEGKDDLCYPYIALIPDKSEGLYFDEEDNSLKIAGDLFISDETDVLKDKLGYSSISIPFNFELVIAIIEAYRKRLGKLKTVLEATK